jgi:hypothetical protein
MKVAVIVLSTLALAHTSAIAQTAPQSAPQSAPPTAPPTAAPAPTPSTQVEQITLVSRDSAGMLQRIARPTEFAAVDMLTLSDIERGGIDALLAVRARELDAAVLTKIELLPRVLRVRSEGATEDVRIAAREIAKANPALRDRQGLAHQCMKVLQGDNPKAFSRVLNEYNTAAVRQASTDARAKGFKGDAFAMSTQESGRQAALEVCESFDRQCAGVTRAQLESMLTPLTLAEDVRAKVAERVESFFASQDSPSRSVFFTELMAAMPMTERIALARALYEAKLSPEAK